MPGRNTPLVVDETYHVFNRGSNKQNIFVQPRDYRRFRQTFYYYQFSGTKPKLSSLNRAQLNTFKPAPEKKLVEIICYCLMPNHFHFLVRQLKKDGISIFISQISNSYTKYFNTKYKRVGGLLQGTFKAELVQTDEQLIHLSRYIHLNPIVAGITKNLENYQWSSYGEYLSGNELICSPNKVLGFFSSTEDYRKFLKDQVEYGTSLEILKHNAIDLD